MSLNLLISFTNFFLIGLRNLFLSKALGPENYGLNGIASQLISLLLFLDIGTFALILKHLSRDDLSAEEKRALLLRIRKFIFIVYLVVVSIFLVIFLHSFASANSDLQIVAMATMLIFPMQSSNMYRNQVLIARGKQRKYLVSALNVILVNSLITFITIPIIGIYCIVLGPLTGYCVGYFLSGFREELPSFRQAVAFAPSNVANLILRSRTMGVTNVLSYLMVNLRILLVHHLRKL